MKEKRKKYSILGDSVSTFAGYTPPEALFYDSWRQKETGVETPEDTWWMQVIKGMGGVLGSNNSYAGSTVSGGLSVSGTAVQRIRALGENGTPDVILVNMGANDWGFCVLPQEFEYEYRRLLRRLKQHYPQAEIWCATLLSGKAAPGEMFFNLDGVISQKIYSDIIRKAAEENDVHTADIGAYGAEYDTVDGVHPTREGMRTIAELWIKELRMKTQ